MCNDGWEIAGLTFVSEVGKYRPDLLLRLVVRPLPLWLFPLPQPQGREQVDPPGGQRCHVVREHPSEVSAALQGHLLQQRGQVLLRPPWIGPYRPPGGFALADPLLISVWLRARGTGERAKAQRSLWHRPRFVGGVPFDPPGNPKIKKVPTISIAFRNVDGRTSWPFQCSIFIFKALIIL